MLGWLLCVGILEVASNQHMLFQCVSRLPGQQHVLLKVRAVDEAIATTVSTAGQRDRPSSCTALSKVIITTGPAPHADTADQLSRLLYNQHPLVTAVTTAHPSPTCHVYQLWRPVPAREQWLKPLQESHHRRCHCRLPRHKRQRSLHTAAQRRYCCCCLGL